MDAAQAERLLRKQIGRTAELVSIDARQAGMYLIEGADEYLFAIHLNRPCVGGSEIMAVNKTTGAVRSAGFAGE